MHRVQHNTVSHNARCNTTLKNVNVPYTIPHNTTQRNPSCNTQCIASDNLQQSAIYSMQYLIYNIHYTVYNTKHNIITYTICHLWRTQQPTPNTIEFSKHDLTQHTQYYALCNTTQYTIYSI